MTKFKCGLLYENLNWSLVTGFSTAKGGLVRSILFPKPMDFSMLKDAMLFIGILAGFGEQRFMT